jgi:hypothetical protein
VSRPVVYTRPKGGAYAPKTLLRRHRNRDRSQRFKQTIEKVSLFTLLLHTPSRKCGANAPKSIGAAKPLPSHADYFRQTIDVTKDGILKNERRMINLVISGALRRFAPPFRATVG